MKKIAYSILFCLTFTSLSFAHFPILILDSPMADTGQSLTVTYSFGHPYEQEYEDAEKPAKTVAIPASGKPESLNSQWQEGTIKAINGTHKNWTMNYSTDRRGDVILAVDTHPTISRDGKRLYQEYVKTVVHIERQRGWDNRSGQPIEILPLTRPYGLQEGFVFNGRLMQGDKPLANTIVYFEQFNEKAPNPDTLPPEPIITQEAKADEFGYFSQTLLNPGWWIIAAYVDDIGTIEYEGKSYKHDGMAGLWVRVEKKNVP